MTTAPRKEREKRRRREAIVDAAEEVIRERGFDSATMDEIAERAELSKGALYLYFENKMALYLAICERGSAKLNRQFADVLALDRTGLELIRKLGEVYIDFIREHPVYFQAFSHYEGVMDDSFLADSEIAQQCEEHARQSLTYITRTLQIGMQDGTIDNSYDPKELAVLIWACSRGVVQMMATNNRGHHFKMIGELDLNMDSLLSSLLKLLENGMVGKRGK